ncbi:hypothetical protein [Flavisolibacter tropicus]|uniref:Uncharacterized protein n=1 Tax=Flavisolibacter tropicus TaxID=1492898 RepID=A0A172TXP8_9BACT|nr:hypothetical protein [Flavisolibacter tropicus]ANE51748.1 hypothetical protein SY85_15845 [Flavisolibacter tropicus]
MLYVFGRALSVLCLLAINVSINIFWFKVSAFLGIAILLIISFVVYRTVALSVEEKKQREAAFNHETLKHLN